MYRRQYSPPPLKNMKRLNTVPPANHFRIKISLDRISTVRGSGMVLLRCCGYIAVVLGCVLLLKLQPSSLLIHWARVLSSCRMGPASLSDLPTENDKVLEVFQIIFDFFSRYYRDDAFDKNKFWNGNWNWSFINTFCLHMIGSLSIYYETRVFL